MCDVCRCLLRRQCVCLSAACCSRMSLEEQPACHSSISQAAHMTAEHPRLLTLHLALHNVLLFRRPAANTCPSILSISTHLPFFSNSSAGT